MIQRASIIFPLSETLKKLNISKFESNSKTGITAFMFSISCVNIFSCLYFYRTIFIYNFCLVVLYDLEHLA